MYIKLLHIFETLKPRYEGCFCHHAAPPPNIKHYGRDDKIIRTIAITRKFTWEQFESFFYWVRKTLHDGRGFFVLSLGDYLCCVFLVAHVESGLPLVSYYRCYSYCYCFYLLEDHCLSHWCLLLVNITDKKVIIKQKK
jgi:hypothetical protein